MFSRLPALGVCLILLGGFFSARADDKVTIAPNQATGPGTMVRVTCVVKTVLPSKAAALSIKFDYKFSTMPLVHIHGLGDVPSKGSFSYVTSEDVLTFSDPATKSVILRVPLQETIAVAARPPLTEIPSEFPEGVKIYDWSTNKSLQQSANHILNKYFQIREYEENNINYIATTFMPIDGPNIPKGTIGQLALQFSFPYNPSTQTFSLHVQSVIREGRELSDEFKPASTSAIIQAADRVINDLVTEIKNGGT